MSRIRTILILIVIILIFALVSTSAFAKKPVTELTNNLSFPAIAVDGFTITPVPMPTFTVPYTGLYPGLTAEEIANLQALGTWYAQKTLGNVWQADFENRGNVDVTSIDWSDNIESLYPKTRSSFRLELTLFKTLDDPMSEPVETLTAFKMGTLENPNSADELQGSVILTNETIAATYESSEATIVSNKPTLVIQYLGSTVPTLIWDTDHWEKDDGSIPTIKPVTFSPELNVGGKYIYGAASGAWKPIEAGTYRLTFYMPDGCSIHLTSETKITKIPTTVAATAMIDVANELTYVDVQVVSKR